MDASAPKPKRRSQNCSKISTCTWAGLSAPGLGTSSTPWRMKAAPADPGSTEGRDMKASRRPAQEFDSKCDSQSASEPLPVFVKPASPASRHAVTATARSNLRLMEVFLLGFTFASCFFSSSHVLGCGKPLVGGIAQIAGLLMHFTTPTRQEWNTRQMSSVEEDANPAGSH